MEDISLLLWATPVFYFWWCFLWVSKPEWAALFNKDRYISHFLVLFLICRSYCFLVEETNNGLEFESGISYYRKIVGCPRNYTHYALRCKSELYLFYTNKTETFKSKWICVLNDMVGLIVCKLVASWLNFLFKSKIEKKKHFSFPFDIWLGMVIMIWFIVLFNELAEFNWKQWSIAQVF